MNTWEVMKPRSSFCFVPLFEEDSNIPPEELLSYGMGLCIFRGIKNLEGARKRVCLLLETLKDCFLLSQGFDENRVKMHDVVRDVAIHIASEGEHIFMVRHDVNSEEFPREDSYEQYSHMSIVANKFDELPSPIVCPKLKLLMIKLCYKESFELDDDFFDGMGELSVLSLSGRYAWESIFPFPASIKRLSNLRTLCLVDLRLDDISIIGKLVTLEILRIGFCELEELPVGIGKLTNLIVLEARKVTRISSGVLSRLVRLEELYMVGVEDFSYSTLRELESLPRLTALTLKNCSGDVIYNNNLGLSSKLARYTLKVGDYDKNIRPVDIFILRLQSIGKRSNNVLLSKIIALEVNETAPLGDWIRRLLKESEAVHSTGKGSNNVLSELQVNQFQNVKDLRLHKCDLVTHLLNISGRTQEVIKFPNLDELVLESLECLTHFCSDNVEGIEFPQLRKMSLWNLREFQNFWPTTNYSNPLFHEKVSCPNLEMLIIREVYNMSALCSHQLPTDYFFKLENLNVSSCGKLRNLMSLSVARGLLSLRKLAIYGCKSMEEVISKEEQPREGTMPLFPMLKQLKITSLPKLRHFFLSACTLEFPSLQTMEIYDCPEMKTFVQEQICVSNDDDLNKVMFDSKVVSCPNLEYLHITMANNTSVLLCSHQLPTDYFTKLYRLYVNNCGKLRNLMSPSVARSLLNLRMLVVKECESLVEVITEEEQQGEGIMTLFTLLETLRLQNLPKLRHFFLSARTLEFPSLEEVMIEECPEMKTFVQEGICVSTPRLQRVNNDNKVKVDDLNKWTQQGFPSKEQQACQSTTHGDESEANYGNESETADDSKAADHVYEFESS